MLTNLNFFEVKDVSNGVFTWSVNESWYKFGLYRYENLRKVRTNTIGINPFKWLKYVLFRKLGKVAKYAGGFSIGSDF